MAEVNYTVQLLVNQPAPGETDRRIDASSRRTVRQEQAGSYIDTGTTDVTTSGTTLTPGNIPTVDSNRQTGYVYLANHGTQPVDFGMDDSGTLRVFGTMKGGEFAFFKLIPGVTLGLDSQSLTNEVEHLVVEI